MRTTKKKAVAKKFDPYAILEPVVSSNILKMGWHEGISYILFKGEVLYVFKDFTLKQFHDIRDAKSVGKALIATGAKGVRYTA